jgi:hypothetical protein
MFNVSIAYWFKHVVWYWHRAVWHLRGRALRKARLQERADVLAYISDMARVWRDAAASFGAAQPARRDRCLTVAADLEDCAECLRCGLHERYAG